MYTSPNKEISIFIERLGDSVEMKYKEVFLEALTMKLEEDPELLEVLNDGLNGFQYLKNFNVGDFVSCSKGGGYYTFEGKYVRVGCGKISIGRIIKLSPKLEDHNSYPITIEYIAFDKNREQVTRRAGAQPQNLVKLSGVVELEEMTYFEAKR
tara:strand:- start:71 stop:529 length:459 start_codon:yes stop_codon:yes gene_type:complete